MVSARLHLIAALIFLLAFHAPVQATLKFLPLHESLICADGSPYGIYVEENPKVPLSQSEHHVLVLMGGGSCANPDDCRKDYNERPFVFSTNYNPETIEGNTVLSSDEATNPSMHNFTKWLIPYCSQDFFLGDVNKGQVGDFTHMGSVLFREAFSHWSNAVFSARQEGTRADTPLETVVVIGISAGAVGLMNHVETVRSAVNRMGVQNLNLVLDAPSVVSDYNYVGKDFNEAMRLYVDVENEFPLCSPTHPFSGLYDSVSELPCCLSTHCMMRHDKAGLASFVLHDNPAVMADQSMTLEKLLILDSAYDPVALLGGTTFLQTGSSMTATSDMEQENAQGTWHMMESAGGQKVRARETAAEVKALALQQPPSRDGSLIRKRVQWVMTSCLSHSYLAPSVEFLWLACEHENYAVENFDMVCNSYGHATQYTIPDQNLVIRIWRTILLWNQVRFEGESIRDIVEEFVTNKEASEPMIDGQAINLRFECAGPNCLSRTEGLYSDQPSCQALIEVENTHQDIPVAFQVTWLIFMGLLIVVSFTIKLQRPSFDQVDNTAVESKPEGSRHVPSILRLQGICVNTTKRQTKCLLHGIDIELQSGTITGLLGRSGSGKSTLLKVLSQNHQSTLKIAIDPDGEKQLSSMTKAYLCQEDPVLAFGNLYPFEYLAITAKLYDADPIKMKELYGFTKELLSRGQQCTENPGQMLNPFHETRIRNLSGGQRRILSIAATFLCEPQLLLLDEPCSGLDTISSLQVMAALQSLTSLSNCAALLTFHQPSEDILSCFQSVVVLNAGRIVLNEEVINPTRTAQSIDTHLLHSYETSQRAAEVEGSNRNLLLSIRDASAAIDPVPEMPRMLRNVSSGGYSRGTTAPTPFETVTGPEMPRLLRAVSSDAYSRGSGRLLPAMHGITEALDETERGHDASEALEKSEATAHQPPQQSDRCDARRFSLQIKDIFRQVRPLAQRIHGQLGFEFTEGVTIIVAFVILAFVLVLDDGSHLQIVLGSAMMICVPSFLYTHKCWAYNELWLSHRFEMDDKRISPFAFQMATSLFTFPGPLLSVLLAVALAYAILGWPFSTFVVQYIFVGAYLLIAMQFGRALCVLFSGNFGPVMKVYTTVLLINAVFSSVFVSSNSFPDSLNFLFMISVTFWALSGAVLNIFNDNNYGLDRHCFDFFSCVFSDGNVAGRLIGFSPLSNSYRALGVLSCIFAFLVVMESLLLYIRCKGHLSLPSSCIKKTVGGKEGNHAESSKDSSSLRYDQEMGKPEVKKPSNVTHNEESDEVTIN